MGSKSSAALLSAVFAVVSALAIVFCLVFYGGGGYADGAYEGSGNGRNGPIEVLVTVSRGRISRLEVTAHKESEKYAGAAIREMVNRIVKEQSPNVDVVAGATLTSAGIQEAVAAALARAQAPTGDSTGK